MTGDDNQRVAADMVVTVAYRLRDAAAELVDTITPQEPLRYVHGYAQIVPGLERGLEGARIGERREITCDPEDAFGERDPAALLEIDRHDFPGGDAVAAGDEIVATRPDGVEVTHVVLEVSAETVLIDLNHPLAGQRVTFEVEVCAARAASDDELDEAQALLDELIVDGSTIVYQSEPAGDLIQLRTSRGNND